MRGRALQYRDFSGGVNLSAGPAGLAENEAGYVRDFRPTARGSLKSRVGDVNMLDSTDVGAQATMSLSAVEGLTAGVADDLLLGMADGKLYRYTSGATASLLGTFTSSGVWDFIDAPVSGGQGPVYGVNGTIAKQITTAPVIADWTASTGTMPSTAKYLAYVGNRVWAAGMSSYGAIADPGSALVFSELGDPRNWPAANIVQFDPNDGEAITGIGEVGAGLLVFKRSKAWLVYDLDTGANRPLGVGVGCISHRSIVQTPYGTVWAGEKQVWSTDGATVRPIGDKLISAGTPTSQGIETHLDGSNFVTTAIFHDNRYLLGVQTDGTTSAIVLYEYDFPSKSWWIHSTLGGLLARAQIASTATPEIYAAGGDRLDHMLASGYYLGNGTTMLPRQWTGLYHTLGPGKDRLRGIEVEGYGYFGLAAVPDFGTDIPGLTIREVRAEENLGTVATLRRESDFKTFRGVQIGFFALGFSFSGSPLVLTPIPGYVPTDVRVDAYTLYVTRRPG